MIFIDVEQNSDEWFELRKGLLTSSKFSVVMANEDKAFGEPAKKLAVKIALEIEKGERIESEFTSKEMERGHELEPLADERYQFETFNTTLNGGFFKHEKILIGGSPDRRIENQNKITEIKSVIYTTQNLTIKRAKEDPSYKWQYQGNIWLSESESLDFISFCPECTYKNQIFICEVMRDDKMINSLEKRINDFFELVEKERQFV